jgi:uncharacterized lipoprotein NlpE involved in copper resistance
MRKIILSAAMLALLSVGFVSCGQKNKPANQENTVAIDIAHNSRNSLDWKGVYTGVISCANCEGISVQITLDDNTYQASYLYLGKKDATPEQFSGKFSWDEAGSVVILETTDIPPYYKVGENRLIQLDMEGNPITGEHADMYVLAKNIE